MLKIAVFGKGLGGEAVADFLASELDTVEIIRVIDWRPRPKRKQRKIESYRDTERQLETYIDKVDLIVLGGYVTSLALEYLQIRHPSQKFVGMPAAFGRVGTKRRVGDEIVLLMDERLEKAKAWKIAQKKLPQATLILPDCSGWEYLIDIGQMTSEILSLELGTYFTLARAKKVSRSDKARSRSTLLFSLPAFALAPGWTESALGQEAPDACLVPRGRKELLGPDQELLDPDQELLGSGQELLDPDEIVIMNTHFWNIEEELKKIFGYRARVTTFKRELLHEVCRALKLRGVDGRIDHYT